MNTIAKNFQALFVDSRGKCNDKFGELAFAIAKSVRYIHDEGEVFTKFTFEDNSVLISELVNGKTMVHCMAVVFSNEVDKVE